jgi:hypothetical protein
MIRYKDINGNSGIAAYEAGSNFIIIRFKDGATYLYNYTQPGKQHVDEMLRLAATGKGLTTYINKYVRENYAEKIV